MATLDSALWQLDQTNRLADGTTWIHRLDSRAKLFTTLIFILLVASHGPLEISSLIPFIIYPAFLLFNAELPLSYVFKRLFFAAPFVVFIAIFNPLIDTQTVNIAGYELRQGWLSMSSILIRFVLTASAALILLASTGMSQLCTALNQFGVPHLFTRQLLLLHRYMIVLLTEGLSLYRATQLRRYGQRLTLTTGTNLLGQLLQRTTTRANRIHNAMLSRNFSGQISSAGTTTKLSKQDWSFIVGWCSLFILMRNINLPLYLGQLLKGVWF